MMKIGTKKHRAEEQKRPRHLKQIIYRTHAVWMLGRHFVHTVHCSKINLKSKVSIITTQVPESSWYPENPLYRSTSRKKDWCYSHPPKIILVVTVISVVNTENKSTQRASFNTWVWFFLQRAANQPKSATGASTSHQLAHSSLGATQAVSLYASQTPQTVAVAEQVISHSLEGLMNSETQFGSQNSTHGCSSLAVISLNNLLWTEFAS